MQHSANKAENVELSKSKLELDRRLFESGDLTLQYPMSQDG